MKMLLRALLLVSALAAPLSAQTTYFVDPGSGSDAADGSQGTPFESLTHALGVAVAGDSISLRNGTYSTDETFPILLKNRVNISAFQSEVPTFDGGGAGTLFQVSQDITALTIFEGADLTACTVGIEIPTGTGIEGFLVRDCNFNNFADSGGGADDGFGILATLDSGGTSENFSVEDCTFAGNSARDGIALILDDGTILSSGALEGNTSSGGVDRAISILARGGSTVAETYDVHDNVFAGYAEAGIFFHALGSGGNPTSTSAVRCQSNGNFLTGAGGTEKGYHLKAEHGPLNESAVVSSWICFGRYTGNDVNIYCETINDGADTADILADFYGNRIENAGRAGVELVVTVPAAGNANNDPNFGPGHAGKIACINTFAGNTLDFRLGAGVTNTISAQFNFFPDGAPSSNGGSVDTTGIMGETLEGTFEASISPDTPGQVRLNASSGSAFVDYDGDTPTGQITVEVDGSALDQEDISALAAGAGLLLQLPALSVGAKTVTVTNPGGQTGTFTLNVLAAAIADAAEGNDCFVATAAHGDYGSHEVYALRRFRDQYLKTNTAGLAFVDWYYDHGPSGAAFLLEHEWARKGARAALTLPVLVADGITNWNPGQRFAFAVLLLGLGFRIVRRR